MTRPVLRCPDGEVLWPCDAGVAVFDLPGAPEDLLRSLPNGFLPWSGGVLFTDDIEPQYLQPETRRHQ